MNEISVPANDDEDDDTDDRIAELEDALNEGEPILPSCDHEDGWCPGDVIRTAQIMLSAAFVCLTKLGEEDVCRDAKAKIAQMLETAGGAS